MRLDWYEKQYHPLIESLVTQLFDAIPPPESLRGVNRLHREQSLKSLSHLFISALYSNHFKIGGSDKVSMPKSPRYFDIKDVSGEKLKLSHRYSIEVLSTLEQLKWIRVTLGKKGINHTLIESSPLLETLFNEIGFLWTPQEPKPEEELIVLRDLKRNKDGKPLKGKPKIDMPLPEYKLKSTHLNNLKKINEALMSHCYHMDLSDENIKALKSKGNGKHKESSGVILLSSIQLSRIFSRGSVELGGRFYRGWWQSIPSEHRPHIRINGNKTVEIDFTAMHLRILYAKAGLDFSLEKDPYDLGLDNWEGKTDPRRKVIKKAINALLNDEDNVFKLKEEDEEILGLTKEEFEKQLQKTHPKLKFSQYKGIGLKLQKLDSDIAEALLLWMVDHDIPCLPVHDSFIVTAGFEKTLELALKRTFKEFIDVPTDVETDIIKIREHFGMTNEEVNNIPFEDMVIQSKDTWAVLEKYFNSNNLMDNYLRSYECTKYS